MRRPTPDKIVGYSLPKSPRINKGNTSIIYQTDDPALLEVFTIEALKLEWWQRGLAITEEYDEVCEAVYTGMDRRGVYTAQFKRIILPVYRCLVRRLDSPSPAQMKRIRQIQRGLNRLPYSYNQNRKIMLLDRWRAIDDYAVNHAPEIVDCVDFLMDRCPENTYPDFGTGDFMSMNGQIVCLDPFHDADLQPAFRLTN